MSNSKLVIPGLREWAEMFMHRSFSNLVLYAKGQGLSMVQFHTLMRLHRQDGCSVTDIGSHLGVTNAGASQMIDRLVLMGLLERTEDPNDRRARQLRVTPRGRSLLEKGMEARDGWLEELPKRLTPAQQATVAVALGYLMEAGQQIEAKEEEESKAA